MSSAGTHRIRRLLVPAALLVVVVFLLFDVSFDPVLRLPAEVEKPDPAREALFAACLEARDREIHRRAFATIDNPDVQREYITAHRETAREDCRREFPVRTTTVREPFRFNLIDLEPRFGRLSYEDRSE